MIVFSCSPHRGSSLSGGGPFIAEDHNIHIIKSLTSEKNTINKVANQKMTFKNSFSLAFSPMTLS